MLVTFSAIQAIGPNPGIAVGILASAINFLYVDHSANRHHSPDSIHRSPITDRSSLITHHHLILTGHLNTHHPLPTFTLPGSSAQAKTRWTVFIDRLWSYEARSNRRLYIRNIRSGACGCIISVVTRCIYGWRLYLFCSTHPPSTRAHALKCQLTDSLTHSLPARCYRYP